MTKKIGLLLILVAFLSFNGYAGKKVMVPGDARTIEAGLEKSEAGDTVFVKNGVYKEQVVLKDEVALIGESVRGTIIRGRGRGILVKGADKAVLRNFTIENGDKGILCENVTMTIEHNCVCGNKSSGIHCLVTLPMIRNNVVYRNHETGIFCETVRSLKTLVEHNAVVENGYSGIMLAGNSEVLIQNNVFVRNKQFGMWVNEGARRSRIVCNDFYLNRNAYNYFAQVDKTNLGVDPGYPDNAVPADLFGVMAGILKEKGRDGKDIGLISEQEMILRGQDADNDGIPDAQDKCLSIAEDRDGFQDEDGCPDFDNDNDGIYDAQDKCPNEPEDKDGFEDADGCPDFDNDKDGIPDSVDGCPGEPETVNGYKDNDGCPDEVPPGWKPESAAPAQDSSKKVTAAIDTSNKTAAAAPDTTKKTKAAAVDTTKKVKAKKPAAADGHK
jgi:OmpA-OmpF porin, OOP family